MPPPHISDLSDDSDTEISSIVYTPPVSNESMSPRFDKRKSDLEEEQFGTYKLQNVSGITNHQPLPKVPDEEAAGYANAFKQTLSHSKSSYYGRPAFQPGHQNLQANHKEQLDNIHSRWMEVEEHSIVPLRFTEVEALRVATKDGKLTPGSRHLTDKHSKLKPVTMPPATKNNSDIRITTTSIPQINRKEKPDIGELLETNFTTLTLPEKVRVLMEALTPDDSKLSPSTSIQPLHQVKDNVGTTSEIMKQQHQKFQSKLLGTISKRSSGSIPADPDVCDMCNKRDSDKRGSSLSSELVPAHLDCEDEDYDRVKPDWYETLLQDEEEQACFHTAAAMDKSACGVCMSKSELREKKHRRRKDYYNGLLGTSGDEEGCTDGRASSIASALSAPAAMITPTGSQLPNAVHDNLLSLAIQDRAERDEQPGHLYETPYDNPATILSYRNKSAPLEGLTINPSIEKFRMQSEKASASSMTRSSITRHFEHNTSTQPSRRVSVFMNEDDVSQPEDSEDDGEEHLNSKSDCRGCFGGCDSCYPVREKGSYNHGDEADALNNQGFSKICEMCNEPDVTLEPDGSTFCICCGFSTKSATRPYKHLSNLTEENGMNFRKPCLASTIDTAPGGSHSTFLTTSKAPEWPNQSKLDSERAGESWYAMFSGAASSRVGWNVADRPMSNEMEAAIKTDSVRQALRAVGLRKHDNVGEDSLKEQIAECLRTGVSDPDNMDEIVKSFPTIVHCQSNTRYLPFLDDQEVEDGSDQQVEHIKGPVVKAGDLASQATTDHVNDPWTTKDDQKLMYLRNRYPKRSWRRIAAQVRIPVHCCKERFEIIKSEDLDMGARKKQQDKKAKLEEEKDLKWNYPEIPIYSQELSGATMVDQDGWEVGDVDLRSNEPGDNNIIEGHYEPLGLGPDNNPGDEYLRSAGQACEGRQGVTHDAFGQAGSGWGEDTQACESSGCKFGFVPHEHLKSPPNSTVWNEVSSSNATPEPDSTAFVPRTYTVTYWATVQCGDKNTDIPIDNVNVSGPVKAILDGPAKKVWKWVQDKGLGDKISLQNAFDLAKDINDGSEEDDKMAKDKDDDCVYRSSSVFSFRHLPKTARSASPEPFDEYEAHCEECGLCADWCCCSVNKAWGA